MTAAPLSSAMKSKSTMTNASSKKIQKVAVNDVPYTLPAKVKQVD